MRQLRQHTSTYVNICLHTSAYVSIHTCKVLKISKLLDVMFVNVTYQVLMWHVRGNFVYCKPDYSILQVNLIKQFIVSTRSGRLHHSYAIDWHNPLVSTRLTSSNTSSGLKPLFESESELTRASITASRVRSGLCASSTQEAVQKSCISDSRFFHCLSCIF